MLVFGLKYPYSAVVGLLLRTQPYDDHAPPSQSWKTQDLWQDRSPSVGVAPGIPDTHSLSSFPKLSLMGRAEGTSTGYTSLCNKTRNMCGHKDLAGFRMHAPIFLTNVRVRSRVVVVTYRQVRGR